MRELPNLLAMAIGVVTLIMGFILVVRQVGAADGEGHVKFFAFEIRTCKVGPGVLFAIFGSALVVIGLWLMPSPDTNPPVDPSKPRAEDVRQSPPDRPLPKIVVASGEEQRPVAPASPPTSPKDKAEPTPQSGDIGLEAGLLRRALGVTASGTCPNDLMGAVLQNACAQQQPNIGEALRRHGAIVRVDYVGRRQNPDGAQSVFRVEFANGATTWALSRSDDGKLLTLFTAEL